MTETYNDERIRAYVITIWDMEESKNASDLTLESLKKTWPGLIRGAKSWATIPSDLERIKPWMDAKINFDNQKFRDGCRWSYADNAKACFISHFKLWDACVETNEPIIILEHDAVFLPINLSPEINNNVARAFDALHEDPSPQIYNLGKPSFGKFNYPPDWSFDKEPTVKIGKFFSSPSYFKGAHSYALNPAAAAHLIEEAYNEAFHVDLFIKSEKTEKYINFFEFYPWLTIAVDEFTTVQKKEGTIAKHSDKVELLAETIIPDKFKKTAIDFETGTIIDIARNRK